MALAKETVFDTPERYGAVTRILHWGMAALFGWIFVSAALHMFAKESVIGKFFWSTHFSVGFALLLLVLVRGLWGMVNASQRPQEDGFAGRAAKAGHIVMYALMLFIPAVAMLRAYGSGRGLWVFGVQLFAQTGEEIPALMAPAHALHGLLGWVLLALIIGHVGMVVVHHRVWQHDILSRILGRKAMA